MYLFTVWTFRKLMNKLMYSCASPHVVQIWFLLYIDIIRWCTNLYTAVPLHMCVIQIWFLLYMDIELGYLQVNVPLGFSPCCTKLVSPVHRYYQLMCSCASPHVIQIWFLLFIDIINWCTAVPPQIWYILGFSCA